MAGRPAASGVHFLLPRIAAELVHAARIGPGDLVFDLGAGLGALTAPPSPLITTPLPDANPPLEADPTMPRYQTPEPISVALELGAGDVRIAAADRADAASLLI